jgi:subtilisin family serine protease
VRAKRILIPASLLAVAALGVAQSATAGQSGARDYVVVFEKRASAAEARAAVEQAGGRVLEVNAAVGVATARSQDADFVAKAAAQPELVGAARDRAIGRAPGGTHPKFSIERESQVGAARAETRPRSVSVGEPLAALQWDMQMIGATIEGSYRRQQGARAVRVGIIDTGVDGSHPDIRPNFNRELSRNFTEDIPLVDGPCEEEPDGSCTDPADVDENEHGTHVAGTVGAPINGLGIAGVAPRVELVNLRAGQDSGFFFLMPTVNALTYAGDNGIDVVNMSYYVDPWLYNCAANPADSPEAQAEQRTIIEATQRALRYARDRNVTLVGAAGNSNTDLGRPEFDDTSPDFPPDAAYPRTVDNSCLDLPTEGEGVISVTSVGPSGRKAYYSNYGTEQAAVAAPGGDRREFFGTERYNAPENRVLAPYPEAIARERGQLNPDGTPNTPLVVRSCTGEGAAQRCAYYQYLQGTSMASPHAAGVAGLIVAEYGRRDREHGGLRLGPARTERILRRGATDTPCPEPRLFDYPDPDLGPEFNAFCEGDADFNGFYGDGIVSALNVLRSPE